MTVRRTFRARLFTLVVATGAILALTPGAYANDFHVQNVDLYPPSDEAPVGTCNPFTATVQGLESNVLVGRAGETVDVIVRDAEFDDSQTSIDESATPVAFCTPESTAIFPNARPTNSTTFSSVPSNLSNDGTCESSGQGNPGCDGDIQGETGPTDQDGKVTFGIISQQPGTYQVTAFYDANDSEADDVGPGGQPEFEDTSNKTFFSNVSPSQCNDGMDNDGDGFTDYNATAGGDPQCSGANDNDESESGGGSTNPSPECDDDSDNDGDEATDFPDDPNCEGRFDDSEAPPTRNRHDRQANINEFKHVRLPEANDDALLVKGKVTVDDGYGPCRNSVPVKVQIRAGGEWITRKSDTTNAFGGFKVLIRDIAAKYRAFAPKHELANQARNEVEVCRKAASPGEPHTHTG